MLAKLKAFVSTTFTAAPFPLGLALGYFGHPFIKTAISAATFFLKAL